MNSGMVSCGHENDAAAVLYNTDADCLVVYISSTLSTAVLSIACIGTHYPKIEDGSAVLVFGLKTDSTTIHLVPPDEQ